MRKVIKNNPKDRLEVDVSEKHLKLSRFDEVEFGIETTGPERTNHYDFSANGTLFYFRVYQA